MITAYNKIGFHCGPAGNHNGIGDYMRQLDKAGIPFVIKSVDHYGVCFEACQYNNAPHVICFRLCLVNGKWFDVPDYSLDPDEAAVKHWRQTVQSLPPEFNKEKVWLEVINEVDKNRSEWLGQFAVHVGQLALQEGYKILQFAWSSGEPEPSHWETEGMLAYLRLCDQNPGRLGIALHEYSFDANDIWRLKPHLIGRFTQLYDICDKYSLKRPQVVLTEWGWTHQHVPDPTTALQHIREANELYAPYPELLGGAIWYLGSGPEWGKICDETQRLIAPVTQFSLNFKLNVEPNRPPTETTITQPPPPVLTIPPNERVTAAPETPNNRAPQATASSNATFMADVTIPDDTDITAGQPFTKTWRVKNSGQTTWGAGYKMVFVNGQAMSQTLAFDVPTTKPGQIINLSVQMTAPQTPLGTVFGDWRLQTPAGQQFGDILYVRITNNAPLPPEGQNNLAYSADITIPDDTVIQPNQTFTKTWEVRNSGSRAWGNGYKLAFVGGASLASQPAVTLPACAPGQKVRVSVEMKAPNVPGTHWADWRAQDEKGNFFGEIIYVRITVPVLNTGRIAPLSQNDPRWKETRLGDSYSDTTIGAWGCLLTCFTMIANSFGKNITPPDLNRSLVLKNLFLDHKITPWNVLSSVYNDHIFDGRLEMHNTPNLTDRIDASLRAGNPVAVQVDYTPDSPYTPNDQHWVLVVGREGNDYRINEPWVYPPMETSMRTRYGRPGQSLKTSIMSAIFYRCTRPQPALPVVVSGVLGADGAGLNPVNLLQRGLNIAPDQLNCAPAEPQMLKGLEWVRFVYRAATQPDPAQRSLTAAYRRFEPTIQAYHKLGVKSLLVLNQETVWGHAPWLNTGNWEPYANSFAAAAGEIARAFAKYGANVAYEIWPQPNQANNPQAIFVPAGAYATLLQKTAQAIRQVAPQASVIFGGLAGSPAGAIAYVQEVQQKLDNQLPVTALGLQPYGRWGTKAPFDWGKNFPPLSEALTAYEKAFPGLPLWVTEMGVPAAAPLDSAYNKEIGEYLRDVFRHVEERYTKQLPVLIWYAWSDLQKNAGLVKVTGQPKPHLFEAFEAMRQRQK